jgi:hypothetical protein
MTTTTELWEPGPILLPDEHRIFRATHDCVRRNYPHGHVREVGAGVWAIADNSGETPDQTDDGILWLDFNNRIMVGGKDRSPTIPVLSSEGKRHVVGVNPATLFVLSDMFRWTLNVNGRLYRAFQI